MLVWVRPALAGVSQRQRNLIQDQQECGFDSHSRHMPKRNKGEITITRTVTFIETTKIHLDEWEKMSTVEQDAILPALAPGDLPNVVEWSRSIDYPS